MPKPSRRGLNKPEALVFSDVCGKGITLSKNNREATRASGFGDAIVFSARTVHTYEKVFLKHRQKQVDWIGSLRVGFCTPNPRIEFTRDTLPSLAFKHLTDKEGYWLRACPDELLRTSAIIYLYYSYDGQIYVGAHGQNTPPQAVLTINEHHGPYYLFCEVYGKTDQIELLDEITLAGIADAPSASPSLPRSRSVLELVSSKLNASNSNIVLHLQYFNYLFTPSTQQHTLTFLPTNTHNIVFTNNNRTVCVDNLQARASYAFVSQPMKLGDVLICKVMDCDANISSRLLFGLTTCNPASIQQQTLPEETTMLIEQYPSSNWFIEHDIDLAISQYDELAFWFDPYGQIHLSINNRPPVALATRISAPDVTTISLYPFFDLYGQVTSLQLYNFVSQTKLLFNDTSNDANVKTLCLICYEHLADAQLLPCQCTVCYTCAMAIKRPSLISECPFDRKAIMQIRQF